jgi:hypothetical protein
VESYRFFRKALSVPSQKDAEICCIGPPENRALPTPEKFIVFTPVFDPIPKWNPFKLQ